MVKEAFYKTLPFIAKEDHLAAEFDALGNIADHAFITVRENTYRIIHVETLILIRGGKMKIPPANSADRRSVPATSPSIAAEILRPRIHA